MEQKKILVFPGSFDPITNGHIDLVKRSIPLFDKIFVAIGINNAKSTLYSLDTRIKWLNEIFNDFPTIEVGHFEGLTVNYCKSVGAKYILRGLRNASDFDYEKTISQLNTIIGDNIDTLFLISKPEFSHISSTIVREIIKGHGDVSNFVPKNIAADMQKELIGSSTPQS